MTSNLLLSAFENSRYADAPAEKPVERADVQLLGVREEALALSSELLEREAEARVEVAIGRRAQLSGGRAARIGNACVALVEMLFGQRDAGAVEPLAPLAVGLIRDRGAQEPVADLLAVDCRAEGCLEAGDLLRVRAHASAACRTRIHRRRPRPDCYFGGAE